MTETGRPRTGHFATAAVVLAVVALIGAGRILLATHASGSVLPSERGGLWLGVRLWRLVPAALVFGVGAVVSALLAYRRAGGEARAPRTARIAGTLAAISLICAALTAMLAPVFVRVPTSARMELCSSSMKSIAAALTMYRDEWGREPALGKWSDATRRYTTETYRCPEGEAACGYAHNRALAGLPTALLTEPGRTVMLFESDRGWNAEGGPELLPGFPRHGYGDYIAFADGHVKWYARKAPRGKIRWDTEWPRRYQREDALQWEPVAEGGGAVRGHGKGVASPIVVGKEWYACRRQVHWGCATQVRWSACGGQVLRLELHETQDDSQCGGVTRGAGRVDVPGHER